MKDIEDRDLLCLRQAGFRELEIFRLRRLRYKYSGERDKFESLAQYRRLQFLRWLVTTGKLLCQLAQAL